MAVLRVFAVVLLALFTIIASWPPSASSASTKRLGAGAANLQQLVSYAAPAPVEAIIDDAVVLLDVTGSMRGEGPDSRARDIWGKTVVAVSDIVDRLAPKTNLALVPFSSGPEWRRVFPGPIASGGKLIPRQLAGNTDREGFKTELKKLVADGEVTWIYESLEYSLVQLRQWREADPGRMHRQALFLYTDGIDNGPHGKLGIDGIVQLVRAQKADYPGLYIVYNDLASHLTSDQKTLLANNGVVVTVGPPTSNVELVTEKLDFGQLLVSSSGVSQDVLFRSGFADVWGRPVRFRVEMVGSTLPMAVVTETLQLRESIRFGLRPTGTLPVGQQKARLIIEPVDGTFNLIPRNSIDLTFNFIAIPAEEPVPTPAPLPPRSIIEGVPDLFLILGVLALVIAGAVVIMWWRQLWIFRSPGPTMQLVWKRDDEPSKGSEEGVRVRTIQPNRSRAAEEWIIGTNGYISLTEAGQAIMLSHAKIAYAGRKRRGFRLVPVGGEVSVRDKSVEADGMALVDGSTFAIGPYRFRFESLSGTDQKIEN